MADEEKQDDESLEAYIKTAHDHFDKAEADIAAALTAAPPDVSRAVRFASDRVLGACKELVLRVAQAVDELDGRMAAIEDGEEDDDYRVNRDLVIGIFSLVRRFVAIAATMEQKTFGPEAGEWKSFGTLAADLMAQLVNDVDDALPQLADEAESDLGADEDEDEDDEDNPKTVGQA